MPDARPSESVLHTDRLTLEPLRRSHALEVFEMLSDGRLYRFIPHDPPPSREALERRFEQLETRRSPSGDDVWLNWMIRLKATGQCIGRVEVTLRPDASAVLAYELGTTYWGKGIATEACGRVIDVLFSRFEAERIEAFVDTRNAASIRLLERLGFLRSGFTAGADVFKGSVSDEFHYTLAKPLGARGGAGPVGG